LRNQQIQRGDWLFFPVGGKKHGSLIYAKSFKIILFWVQEDSEQGSERKQIAAHFLRADENNFSVHKMFSRVIVIYLLTFTR
jgi:hypothetical protein